MGTSGSELQHDAILNKHIREVPSSLMAGWIASCLAGDDNAYIFDVGLEFLSDAS